MRREYGREAAIHYNIFKKDPLVVIFNNWISDFGIKAFRIAFDLIRLLRINLCSLPNESHRDAVTALTLSRAIPEEKVIQDLKIAGIWIDERLFMSYKRALNLA
jgi:hypothetical protein